jgi:hypothetical protein
MLFFCGFCLNILLLCAEMIEYKTAALSGAAVLYAQLLKNIL